MKKLLDRIGQGLPTSVPPNVCKGELGRTSCCFDIMGWHIKTTIFKYSQGDNFNFDQLFKMHYHTPLFTLTKELEITSYTFLEYFIIIIFKVNGFSFYVFCHSQSVFSLIHMNKHSNVFTNRVTLFGNEILPYCHHTNHLYYNVKPKLFDFWLTSSCCAI